MLHTYRGERVSLERWEADTQVTYPSLGGGLELYVLQGSLIIEGEEYMQGSWCRFPCGAAPKLKAGSGGVQMYLKRGHLAVVNVPDQ